MDKSFSIFCIDLYKRVSLLSNYDILPSWLKKRRDEFLFDVIMENFDYMQTDDKSLFQFIYSNLVNYNYAFSLTKPDFEFTIRLRDGNVYIAYRFLMYVMDNGELYGVLYKDCVEEIFDHRAFLAPVVNYIEFSSFVTKMIDVYDDTAIVQVDVNGFKTINAVYGIDTGDALLHHIFDTLKSFLSTEGKIIHQVSDVFTVAVRYYDSATLLEGIKLIDSMLSTFNGITLRLSWGVYIVEDKNLPIRSMLDNAAFARKAVKENAIDNINIYESIQQEVIAKRVAIEAEMFHALSKKEFKMYVQPKFNIVTGDIIGGEALIRWVKPDGSIIPPDEFIPIFEADSFIIKIDKYVWEEACKLLSKWKEANLKTVPISVNVSRCHLADTSFIDYIDLLVERYNIDRNYLQIEITESVNIPLYGHIMMELRKRGYTLLMDDFGSGYSSLNTLQHSDFDVIKLDKEFINYFMDSDKGKKIISHIISMIQDINLKVIAEGVETKDQADFLTLHGCYAAQGFLYAKPLSVQEFEELLHHDTCERTSS